MRPILPPGTRGVNRKTGTDRNVCATENEDRGLLAVEQTFLFVFRSLQSELLASSATTVIVLTSTLFWNLPCR